MDTIRSLEAQLVEINKSLPKLPKGFTKWLADCAWIFTLLAVIFSIITLVMLVPVLLVALGISTVAGLGTMFAGYGFNPLITPLAWLSVLLSFVTLIISVVIESMAVSPLKQKQHRGWQLIFAVALISTAIGVVSSIVTAQLGSLIVNLVFYAIGFYVLLQVRPYFLQHAKKTASPAFKPAKK